MIPRITGASNDATSFKGLRLLRIAIDLNFSSTCFFDLELMNVAGISRFFPLIQLNEGRILKPKKSYCFGYFFSDFPLRFTILVFTGCSCSLQSFKRCVILANTYFDCFSVLQCTTISLKLYTRMNFLHPFVKHHMKIQVCHHRAYYSALRSSLVTFNHISILRFSLGFQKFLPVKYG